MRVATAISCYPFYNFRYLKLLHEFSRVFEMYVFAGSKLKAFTEEDRHFKLCYTLPFIIPRRVRYYVGPLVSQLLPNLVKPDVVWLFDTAIPLTPLIIKPPIILDIDDPNFTPSSRFSLLRDFYLLRNRRVKKIVVPTDMIKEKFMKLYSIPEDKIVVVPNGVDLELFRPTKLPEEDIILYYGTLSPHRSRFLVKVLEEVLKRKKDVKFIITGDVPSWLKDYLAHKGFMENIIIPGFIEHDKLPEWLMKAKVCIFTQDISLGRGFSLKLIEYMASGRPIVATDVDESWPVKESGAGIVTSLNPEIFAENVIKLLEDSELCEKLAEKGIKYARRYSWEDICKKYVELMREVGEM